MAQDKKTVRRRPADPQLEARAAASALEITHRERSADPHASPRHRARRYEVSVRGPIPPELNDLVAAAHAAAIRSTKPAANGPSAVPSQVVAR